MCPLTTLLNTLLLLVFHFFHFSTSTDTIRANQSIQDGDVIVSGEKMFALGFFSPGKSLNRYVGIWYYLGSEQTVVWVANRDHPISGKFGVLSINSEGNLVLYETNQTTVPVWSTNVSITSGNDTVARLLDSGNLELVEAVTTEILWQSFDHPTHTLLPRMKLGFNRRADLNWSLTSWKSPDDPGSGNYFYRLDQNGFPQLAIYNGSVKRWRAGSWSGKRWIGMPETMPSPSAITNTNFVNNQDEAFLVIDVTDPITISRTILNESGYRQHLISKDQGRTWDLYWYNPHYPPCDYYGHCGTNSNCNSKQPDEFECTCLPGYEPKFQHEWNLRNGSGGCTRKPRMSICQKGDRFEKVEHVKVPDTSVSRVDMNLDLEACGNRCLRDCSCMAYTSAYSETNEGAKGCLTYYGEMMDTRFFPNDGQDLFVRIADESDVTHSTKAIEGIVIASFCAMLLMVAAMTWFFRRKIAEKARKSKISLSLTSSTNLEESFRRKEKDLPLLHLRTIATATNNFCSENKLGEGGFGPVYKGQLPDGQEIAVKRLSSNSKQGISEFKNEVLLIAKLQHKNLVRLLGYCIEQGEKMLIYEFMPNKSLDYFIFDQSRKRLLDWRKRFDIILEIARGILYLHQDSRLRIIHRDLKASNILLDGEMKPKISDFGTAKIFGADETQANTNKVVGTYGYMSPEYILDGIFSTKSDIFSFGVIVLEIISGKRNRSLCHDDPYSSLTQYIWELWRDGKALEIVDSCLTDSFLANEVLRCIQVGLLCVQDKPKDRPSLSSIVFMLSNETILPSPKKSTFMIRKNVLDSSISVTKSCSINDMTNTTLYAR